MILFYLCSLLIEVKGSCIIPKYNYEKLIEIQKDFGALGTKLSKSIKTFENTIKESDINVISEYPDLYLFSKSFKYAMESFDKLGNHLKEIVSGETQLILTEFDDPKIKRKFELQIEKSKEKYKMIMQNINILENLDYLREGKFLEYKKHLSEFYYDFLNFTAKIKIGDRGIYFCRDGTVKLFRNKLFRFTDETTRNSEILMGRMHAQRFVDTKRFMESIEHANSDFIGVFTFLFDIPVKNENSKIMLDDKKVNKIKKRISELEYFLYKILSIEYKNNYPIKTNKLFCNIKLQFNMLLYCLYFIKAMLNITNMPINIVFLGPLDVLNKIFSLLEQNEAVFKNIISQMPGDVFDDGEYRDNIFDLMCMNRNLKFLFMMLLKNNNKVFFPGCYIEHHPMTLFSELIKSIHKKINNFKQLTMPDESKYLIMALIKKHETLLYVLSKVRDEYQILKIGKEWKI